MGFMARMGFMVSNHDRRLQAFSADIRTGFVDESHSWDRAYLPSSLPVEVIGYMNIMHTIASSQTLAAGSHDRNALEQNGAGTGDDSVLQSFSRLRLS